MTKENIILPGTTVSKEDADAMNKILNQYDKTLFRIDTYENGKRKKTRGTLTDLITDKRLTSELAAGVTEGFSQYAIQVHGFDDNPTLSPTPKARSTPPGTTTNPAVSTNPANSTNLPVPGATTDPTKSDQKTATTKDLFHRLKKILKKYQRK